jgi:hypothetical protein
VLDRIGQTFDSFGPAAGEGRVVEALDPQLSELTQPITHSTRPVLFDCIAVVLGANFETLQGMSV